MTTATWIALAAGLVVGACAVPLLVSRGREQLQLRAVQRSLAAVGVVLGGGTGAAVVAVEMAQDGWWFVPAMMVWACALCALAICDGTASRIPTPLARQATMATAAFLVAGAAIGGVWLVPLIAVVASATASATFFLAWRYLGAGLGDVRLAALGGLGMGSTSPGALAVGLCAWTAVVALQAAVVRRRGRSVGSLVPLGPGLAAGLLAAALVH